MSDASRAPPFGQWERMVAARYLRAKRSQGGVAVISLISFIGITLVYRRLKHETIIEPFMLTRERDPKKAAEAEALRDEAAQQNAKA